MGLQCPASASLSSPGAAIAPPRNLPILISQLAQVLPTSPDGLDCDHQPSLWPGGRGRRRPAVAHGARGRTDGVSADSSSAPPSLPSRPASPQPLFNPALLTLNSKLLADGPFCSTPLVALTSMGCASLVRRDSPRWRSAVYHHKQVLLHDLARECVHPSPPPTT